MRKILLALAAVVALSGSAFATEDSIEPTNLGWVKTADIECSGRPWSGGNYTACELKSNYAGKNCNNFDIPVYDRPNGKIIGTLSSEAHAGDTWVQGRTVGAYTFLKIITQEINPPFPIIGKYTGSKDLKTCG
jgi:hypothetical protein